MSDDIDDKFRDPAPGSQLFTAHVAASMEFEAITKGTEGYGYKYADLAAVRKITTPVLAKHGLTIIQMPVAAGDGHVGVRTILAHISGDMMESMCTTPISVHKGMSSEQCMGTAITYLRRYAWVAVCGLATEADNDAAAPRAPKNDNGGNAKKGGW